jgi:homocysteine S-methyltransferase
MSYEPIREKLATGKTVILDGAIGTEILRRDVTWADHQLKKRPDVVRAIHTDYIKAGADVISTNSFQLCQRALNSHFRDKAHRDRIAPADWDSRVNDLLTASVRLAVEARDKTKSPQRVAVAAAVTTLEWCFRPDLAPTADEARAEYEEIFGVMKDAGADLALLETVNSVTEGRVGLEAARKVGIPCWVAFVCDEQGKLFTGETMKQVADALQPIGVEALLVNCAPPDDITAGLKQLQPNSKVPTGTYAHIGRFDPPEWLFTDEYPPARYKAESAKWKGMGARILGGCCGTTPDHIAQLRSLA